MNDNHINYKQLYAIKVTNEKRILRYNPKVPNRSGIYFLLREENGFKYGYVGQAQNLLSRLADHLRGFQHIDLSIRKHGLYTVENPTGYKIHFLEFPVEELDEKEQYYIKKYANAGYQMRNATVGGQGEGKSGLDKNRPPKGYYDGLEQGKKNVRKFIKHLFDLHLDYMPKKEPPTKLQKKAMQKFKDFLENDE